MQSGIHFISGLPRAGSTLLAALLRQNPNFHAAMSSPAAGLYSALLGEMSARSEFAVFIDDSQREAILRGAIQGYYHAIHPTQLVFDTNRAWCSKLSGLTKLYPCAKMICCVRHISWIMDSIERLIRHNSFQLSRIFGFETGGTVYTRVARLAMNDGMVGYALDALREAFYGEYADRLILVTYETLTKRPAATMRAIYDFIGEPLFEHDFGKLDYAAKEFDGRLGTPGLHTVARAVRPIERPTILPPDLFRRFDADAFWLDPNLNRHNVPVI
jgi:sulfotransferase